ncbi:MAG TPA: chaperone modulator CbpM [Gammaproteobacteria bacterium]|nr:chaperone modulator CbpM [Gammaproteobacteria bacterium]
MKAILSEMLWLDEHHTISLSELSELSGLAPDDLTELIDYGVIAPVKQGVAQVTFHARYVLTAKTARRLRNDFELDARGVALAMTLIERVRELEVQISELAAKLPRRII